MFERIETYLAPDRLEKFCLLDPLYQVIFAAQILDHVTGLMAQNTDLLMSLLAPGNLGVSIS